jgi:hypothetical protein
MNKFYLKDFFKGWIVGNFKPTLLDSKDVEVAIQSYKEGDEEQQHYHLIGTEISLMVLGSASFNGKVLREGEGVVIEPKESNIFKAITDCKVLVVKYPSNTDDKYLGEYND